MAYLLACLVVLSLLDCGCRVAARGGVLFAVILLIQVPIAWIPQLAHLAPDMIAGIMFTVCSVIYGKLAIPTLKLTWRSLGFRKHASGWVLGFLVNGVKATCEAIKLVGIIVCCEGLVRLRTSDHRFEPRSPTSDPNNGSQNSSTCSLVSE